MTIPAVDPPLEQRIIRVIRFRHYLRRAEESCGLAQAICALAQAACRERDSADRHGKSGG